MEILIYLSSSLSAGIPNKTINKELLVQLSSAAETLDIFPLRQFFSLLNFRSTLYINILQRPAQISCVAAARVLAAAASAYMISLAEVIFATLFQAAM